jgi:hypothetical protein
MGKRIMNGKTSKYFSVYMMFDDIFWFLYYYSGSYRGSFGNNNSSKIYIPVGSTLYC